MARPTGIVERHSRSCPSRNGGTCAKPCTPSFEAWIWSARDKRKIRRSFPTFSVAKGWRSDAIPEVKKGKLGPTSRRTVEQAAREWLGEAKAGKMLKPDGKPYKPSVLRTYESDLKRHLIPELGAVRLSNLRRRDVQGLVKKLVGLGLSGSRVRGAIMPLRAICRHALRNDELLVNPTANLDLPAAAGIRERVASSDEAAALLAALPDDDRALWATALYAGLRRGELRGLRADDVDLAERVIHVRRGWDDVAGEIEPKSRKGARRVPLNSELRRLLLEHLAQTGRRGADLVFGRTAVDPFTPTHIRKRALKAWASGYTCGCDIVGDEDRCTRHGAGRYEPIGLHECRHTYVSLLHDAGFSLERIGDYVGHSSTYMTDRYRHLLEGHEREAADILDAYLARKTGAHTGAHLITAPLEPAQLSRN